MSADASQTPLQACFHASYQQLLQFFARKTGSPEDAQELTQELWLNLQRSEAQGTCAEDTRAYIFGIAHNLLVDHLRKRQLIVEHANAWQTLHPEETCAPDTAQQVAQRQVLQAIDAALQAMPERTRQVYVQHRIHGVGHDELADQWGVTRSTIERDVIRASRAVDAVLARWQASAGENMDTATTAQGKAKRRRHFIGALFGLGALLGTSGIIWSWWREHMAQWQTQLATAIGQQQTRTLVDGSRITLDAASSAVVAYYANRRHVQLQQGAAFFDVTKEEGRPFMVDADDVRVVVLGTRFSVELLEDAQHSADTALPGSPANRTVEIAVESGLVRVEPLQEGTSWQPQELRAGDVLRITPGQAAQKWALATHEKAAPWRSGQLSLRNTPLGEVAQRLQRYANMHIEISPAAAALPVTAEIQIAQANEWLRMLPKALPVVVQWQQGTQPGLRIQTKTEKPG